MATRAFEVLDAYTGEVTTTKKATATGCFIVRWSGLKGDTNDVGEPYYAPDYPDKSFQVTGSDGTGGNCLCEVTNEQAPGGSEWVTAADPQGNAISGGKGILKTVTPNNHAIRPRVSAGDAATDYAVYLLISTVARR